MIGDGSQQEGTAATGLTIPSPGCNIEGESYMDGMQVRIGH